MCVGQSTLAIRRKSSESDVCDIFVRGEAADLVSSTCSMAWPTFREKLRDAWSISETELEAVEKQLLTIGSAKLSHSIHSPAQILALGLAWPIGF
jgi:hypothetical protein